ncbi:NAD(P)-dependent dehydrogenase, short-chain alcohol dehydrogenase family [Sanguibacter gelidistatuariae]|uniref:NAD(P)-dependent dehydrogenase, short-chain alcohol dehydrogenase family n=1 Tax=Sanguibacter gelidistatuariae TaxID=1814289 RepID=A0A1G6UXI0_9MICO|nr:3-ketoacyl-ACP reductase [Sanguibacter gelidistatuariae]SDD46022.1 NAD(P)-dependent dehydrogenase, short-chain alcohol dehydrogenase family [Sanguibacter gelidistatuariae]
MPKVALVTGGNRGIGLGITRRLLADGYAVAILATRPEPTELLDELRAGGPDGGPAEVLYVQGSVAELADHDRFVAAALEAWGRIDLLVNNAGVAPSVRADLLEAGAESFDRVLGINLRGPYFLTQRVANAMIDLRGERSDATGDESPVGTIINVSSISATAVSTNRGEYCVSKAGVSMGTQLFAVRLAPEGIVVYEVRPGVIATDMTAAVTEKYDTMFADGLAPNPRWGRPSDVAGAVAILASGQTPYSTGEVFHVDGGMHIPRL